MLNSGNQLGQLGARIVAETFIRTLKHDGNSFMNVSGAPGTFTIADMLEFSGVLVG